ncbi:MULTISPECIES: hypothetical protein [Vagococcus]|uniref:Sugar transporter n=1 Tax=Vagococcus fluvialis bH819 TaxID=1255619 RepID=A0A1X6WKP5_9ENTE|nr:MULTISPECIES: hypothetical protein [Vagococcus]SLM84845.1 hypothetical protein FM121_02040 [Vagococcus fluvialis bH819]HCM89150.1 hypothetical protein [Vagococcus sp.]
MEESVELNKKKLSLKVMSYNRFLMIRYTTAVFFFSNLYWMVFLLYQKSSGFIIPLLLLGSSLLPIIEQIKLYREPTSNAPLTKIYYKIQLGANFVLITTSFTPIFKELFFFMNQDKGGKLSAIFILLVGVILSLIMLQRLTKIQQNQDKQYDRVKKYEKLLGI